MSDASKSRSRLGLLKALNTAKPAVGKGNFVPVLSHFCFNGEQVVACDDVVTIGVECDVPYKVALPADLLLKLLNSLSSADLTIEQKGSQIILKCGRSELKVASLPSTSFVYKVQDHEDADCAFPLGPEIVAGVAACLLSVGNDPTHPSQMGVTLDATGDKAVLYSTDNKTMSRYLLKKSTFGMGAAPKRMIWPTSFCTLLVAMSKEYEEEEAVATIDAKTILVRFGDAAFLQAKLLLSDTMLDFAGVFDSNVAKPITDSAPLPALWEESWTRACAVVDPSNCVTRIDVLETGVLDLKSSSKIGEADDTLQLAQPKDDQLTLTELTCYVNPHHVLRAVGQVDHVAFAKGSVLLEKGRFLHLVSHVVE